MMSNPLFSQDTLLNNISKYLEDQGVKIGELDNPNIDINIRLKENQAPINSMEASRHKIWIEKSDKKSSNHSKMGNFKCEDVRKKAPKVKKERNQAKHHKKQDRKMQKQFRRIKDQMMKTLKSH
jgi:hypothetical protein